MPDLPTDLLRSFVAFAEAGGLGGAAERVGRSPSAVSLHLKQLEARAGVALARKAGRTLALTPAGHLLLAHARRILAENDAALSALGRIGRPGPARLGIVQDFAETILPGIIAALVEAMPEIDLRLRIGSSAELVQALGADAVDTVVVVAAAGGPAPARQEPMVWLGRAGLSARPILPLAMVSRPCPFWTAAAAALAAAGRDHAVALETPSLAGVRAAAAAGFALACRTPLAAGPGLPALGPDSGLPALPEIGYTLLARPRPAPAARLLGEITGARLAGPVTAAPPS